MLEKIGLVILANLIPTVEQIGGIPLGIALGLGPVKALLFSLLVNTFLFFPVYFGLQVFYTKLFSRIKIFRKYLRKVRKKGKPYVDKYGVLGITIFISLPSPFTGTYTGAILSWLLDLDWRKAVLAIFLGSLIGGVIILLSSLGIFTVASMIMKF